MHGPAATQAKNKTLSEQFEKAHFCPSGLVKKGLKKYIFVHSATQSRRKSSILLPWSTEDTGISADDRSNNLKEQSYVFKCIRLLSV